MPSFAGAPLVVLDLNSNGLLTPGPIPAAFATKAWHVLELEGTHRTGEFPAWLGTLPELGLLDLSYNDFAPGPLPDLTADQALTVLSFTRTHRTGPFPAWLSELSALTVLVVAENPFTPGPLSDLSGLTGLSLLWAWETARTGPLPGWINRAPSLTSVMLQGNRFTGSPAILLGAQSKLVELCLEGNQLRGAIPPSVVGPTVLAALDIRWNALQATEPVAAFLNLHSSNCFEAPGTVDDFRNTQTLPPRTGYAFDKVTSRSLTIHWAAVRYTADGGSHAISIARNAAGPFTLVKRVPKTATQADITGLLPNTKYYFQIITTTQAHGDNPTAIKSAPGPVVAWTTKR
jgi:hypothetical protein